METCNDSETKENSKDDFSKWNLAVASHTNGDFTGAIRTYSLMNEASSRIYYNMAIAYVKLGDTRNALVCLTSAVEKDENLAIAFFQRGTIYLQRKSSREAIPDLEKSRSLLRGNLFINYRPLGLLCHLSEFTILYNLALAYLLNGDVQEFRKLLTEATHNADTFQRGQISDTLKLFEEAGFLDIQPIQQSTDAVFVPPKEITKNLERRKSSKRSLVVFVSDENDNTPSYKCAERAEELRTTLSQNQRTEIKRGGSVKDRLFQKMKSTGDLNISSHVRRNLSARKHRHSTGSVGPDSEIPYKALKGVKQSKTSSQINDKTITERSEPRPNDRNYVKGNDGKLSRNDKDRINNDLVIDHFDADTENILVSTQLMKDESTDEKQSEKSHTGGRRFEGKTKSCGDLKNNKKKELKPQSKSTGYLDRAKSKSLLPLERKKKSRISFKQLGRPKSYTKEQMIGNTTVLMDGCLVGEDLLNIMVPADSDLPTRELPDVAKGEVDNAAYSNSKSRCQYSLGSVFGDRSTVVKYALTEACDVITATATPTINPFALKSFVSKDKKNASKQKDKLSVEKRKVQQSSKKKRAPDPPKSNVYSSLLAAGQLLTAMVHHDPSHRPADSTVPLEPSEIGKNKAPDDSNIMTDSCSQKVNRTRLEVKTSETTTLFEEVSVDASLSNTFDTAFMFPPVSETDISQDINNNEAIANKNHPEHLHTKEFVAITEGNDANEKAEGKEKGRGEISCEESIDGYDQQQKSSVSTRMRHIFKPKRASKPPPSYPPPPLRINSQKKRYAQKDKKEESSLNGIIGKSLLTSGMMIGAIVPTHDDTDANNLITACLKRDADDIISSGNVNEMSNLMESACNIGKETSDKDDHVYENVREGLKEFPTYMNIGYTSFAENNIGHSQQQHQQEQLESIDEVHPASPNILRAFVISNEKIQQAFGEFLLRQRSRDTQDNAGLLLNGEVFDDIKHDYVNVTEF